ncbi:hypothetical protein BpHYR1_038033 [Brachionus plicatilis]|uniref:Uncharacterized protein n=1 Tax=Brachionus plicatilis TaxID=10195 RepID=A0A3M7R756_BRAPC|nr:hypothetical protein BpHYR1_038033 [Brachionus plicatilis]
MKQKGSFAAFQTKIVHFLIYTCNESKKAPCFNYNQDVISDVSDGEYYNYFKTNMPSNNSGFEYNYSKTLNTDGIELSLKTNISIWPVYLSINEIPIQYRFYNDNILIADGKPERLDEFLEPIITDLKMLELGTRIGNQIYRFFYVTLKR